jgi:acylphosphatase
MRDGEAVRRYRVTGRVQGVGFRAWVVRQAAELDVRGWVRNRADGSVELLASAPGDVHLVLEQRLGEGPRFARVDRVDVTREPDATAPGGGFGVRPDA